MYQLRTDDFLERELAEARGQEAEYRTRLARHRELSAKLRTQAGVLRDALRGSKSDSIAQLLIDVTRLSAQALGVARAGLWLFDEKRESLICRFLLLNGEPQPTEVLHLPTARHPGYIAAVDNAGIGALVVGNVMTDPRTSELHDYARAHGVGALLDIPVFGPGTLRGIVCHEAVEAREWREEEVDFAADVGSLVAMALEAEGRRSAESAARGSEAKYRQLVESLPVTVYSFQVKTGQLDYLSPRLTELSGWPIDAVADRTQTLARWVEAIDPEDRAPVLERLATGIRHLPEEIVYRVRVKGQIRWVRDTCTVVRDTSGSAIAIQGTLADITALKEAERARAELERRFRTLLENVDMIAVILGPTGRIEFVNDCFARSTGFTQTDALGADWFDLVAEEWERAARRAEYLSGVQNGTAPAGFQETIRTRSGATLRVLWTSVLLHSGSGEIIGTANLGIDLSERLAREAHQLEEQKLDTLGRFSASVAHDVNNLLMIISGSSYAFAQSDNPQHRTARANIGTAIEQAASLTRSLMAYARREEIAPQRLLGDAVLENTASMVEKLLGEKLSFSFERGAPNVHLMLDPGQLRQVVLNLAGNAADATRGHGTRVRMTTNVIELADDQATAQGLARGGAFWVLKVADDGRGMTEELRARVFEPFFTTKKAGEGTGLGLAICSSIVRRAGGFITVESEPGKGTTFRVHLPVVE